VNVGEYLNPGTPIVTLQALDPVYVDFTLPEQDLAQVATGQTVTVSVDAHGDRRFTGKVSAVEPLIDSQTRNFKVRATFANADA
ncbi:efflux RND transporter periplasmic adaptor subunit, partial [Acinetobacter baumannii]